MAPNSTLGFKNSLAIGNCDRLAEQLPGAVVGGPSPPCSRKTSRPPFGVPVTRSGDFFRGARRVVDLCCELDGEGSASINANGYCDIGAVERQASDSTDP